MTKRKILTLFTGLLIVASILFTMIQNKDKDQILENSFFYLGTIIKITIYDSNDPSDMDEIKEMIASYDLLFDRNKAESDISILNDKKTHTVDDATYYVIETALKYGEITSGYFDITINPIVDLWRIGTEEENVPSHEAIIHTLKNVNYQNITLSENNQIHLAADTTIDLGGIAKGFIADELMKKMKDLGIKKALINLGGNVYALGSSTDQTPWNIGVRHPEEDHSNSILMLMLTDKSIVTSGVSERFFISDDKRYHHILNPFTGYPIENNILSVTIVSEHSIDGDALATGMFALGIDEGFKIINDIEDIQMLIITNDFEIYYSSSLEKKIELFDTDYKLIKK